MQPLLELTGLELLRLFSLLLGLELPLLGLFGVLPVECLSALLLELVPLLLINHKVVEIIY